MSPRDYMVQVEPITYTENVPLTRPEHRRPGFARDHAIASATIILIERAHEHRRREQDKWLRPFTLVTKPVIEAGSVRMTITLTETVE